MQSSSAVERTQGGMGQIIFHSSPDIGHHLQGVNPMQCQLCQHPDFEVVSDRDAKARTRLVISLCSNCGLIQQTPMPSEEALRRFYTHDYRTEYKGIRTPKPKHIYRAGKIALERIAFLLNATKKPAKSILDIGAGGGEFVYLCGKLGFGAAAGLEPNIGYCQHAKKELLVDLKCAELNDGQGSYEIVTFFHILEHLGDPLKAFEKLSSLVEENGRLFVEVPWIESLAHSPANIYFKAHTLYFSATTLTACASRYFTPEIIDTNTGNLRVLFRKRTSPAPLQLPTAESVSQLKQRIQEKGWWSYLLKGKGFMRFFEKIRRTFEEYKVQTWSAKNILDGFLDLQIRTGRIPLTTMCPTAPQTDPSL